MTPLPPAPDARPNVYLGRHLEWVRRTLARKEPGYRFKWDIYFHRLEELARTATKFLDAGCGDNKTAAELIGPRIRVGIDVERDTETSATVPGQRVAGRLEQLPFQYGTFDLVGCRHVVEHLDDPLTVFSDLARVMAPGGRVLIQTVNRSSPLIALTRLLGSPVRRWFRRHRYGRSDADPFPLRDRFNRPALFENPPAGFRLVSLEMTQDVDLQSHLGFWLSYMLVRWTKNRPNKRSTITAEWERV
ncbi:MAG: class I SAM-dependent methyltransferase [candidate division Zixibacteria bacterium]|nr:class I SAM-dependent methyltransferase [candidate division Zixibacteria bacterium]